MKIGIDLDDVVFEFMKEVLGKYKENYKKEILFGNVFTYNFPTLLNLPLEEVLEFFKTILTKDFVEDMTLCEFSKETILELANKNEIYFITSRVFREGTKESLEKNFSEIDFKLIFSSNPHVKTEGCSKEVLCNNLNIDFMIEDDPKHVLNCANAGVKTILLDKPWNKKLDDTEHENIFRVNGWEEIIKLIKNFEEDGH